MKTNDTLHRIMSFEEFIDMVQSKKLTLVNPSKFEDPYETWLIERFFDENYLKDRVHDEQSLRTDITNNALLKHTYIRSWTKNLESDALWRIYSQNKTSVCVSVKTSNANMLSGIGIVPIIYVDNIEEYIKGKNFNFIDIITTKRTAFKHEDELRMVYINSNYHKNPISHAKLLTYSEIIKRKYSYIKTICDDGDDVPQPSSSVYKLAEEWQHIPKIYKISFEHIENFIDTVTLDPRAPSWFDETVSLFCENNNVKYSGKSKLYTPI